MRACLGLKTLDNYLDVLGGLESLNGLKVLDGYEELDGLEVLVLR